LEPELRPLHQQLTRLIVRGTFILLGVWLIWKLTLNLWTPAQPVQLILDLALAAALAGAALVALRWSERGRLVESGFLISGVIFCTTWLSSVLSPQYRSFMPFGLALAILTVGAIAGGGSVFLFAGAAVLATVVTAFVAPVSYQGAPLSQDPPALVVYLAAQVVLFLVLAALLESLWRSLRQTVGKLQEQAERLTELALTDPLTELANRRHFIHQLEREFTRARRYRRPLSLLFLDLDNFKGINDRMGHMVGDEILHGSGRSMQAVLRSTDLLARIGGDEFAVLLPETTLDGASKVASKLRRALAAYGKQVSSRVPPLTFCAGVAQLTEADVSFEDMLTRADKAQYLAKSTGKNHARTQLDLETPVSISQGEVR
jgi:diguanylate cyclase (GGDEF)-like protein